MNIQQVKFASKHYLTIKKSITTKQITDKDMYDSAFHKLHNYLVQNNQKPAGHASVIYFKWDEANDAAEIGMSFPVSGLQNVNDPDMSIVDIPESKAVAAVLHGDYSGLAKIHNELGKYINENKLNSNIAIEEYVSMKGPEPETKVYYLYS